MYYYAKIEKDGEGYFQVQFDDLPGTITFGNTLEHALAMAKEALNLMLNDEYAKFNPPSFYMNQAGYYPIAVAKPIAMALKLRWAREGRAVHNLEVSIASL